MFKPFWSWQPSLKLPRLMQPLDRCPAAERLFCAILQADEAAVLSLVGSEQCSSDQVLTAFRQAVNTSNLAVLVSERLWQLDLVSVLGEATMQSVSEQARLSAQSSLAMNEHFHQMCQLTGKQVIWIKGQALARCLYEQNQFRISRDLDLLVPPGNEESVLNALVRAGFEPLWQTPGYSPRYGLGPTGSFALLRLNPSKEFVPTINLSLRKQGWPLIELKFDPLDNGLRTRQWQKFLSSWQTVSWQGEQFLVPAHKDHLLLALTHFHKHGFTGWHWLYDIHLLCQQLTLSDWQDLVESCQIEGVTHGAWAGLTMSRDRLKSPVPDSVLAALEPKAPYLVIRYLCFTTPVEFLWYTMALPVLLMNALFCGDRARKLKTLAETALPSRSFLCRYYLQRDHLNSLAIPFILLAHWLVLLLPGSIARRTLGYLFWVKMPGSTKQ